ncbi:MAG: hypothetical protein ACPGPC_10515 [Alphaproteobacteria bacterium]
MRLSVPDFSACAAIYYEQGLKDGLSGLVGLVSGGQRDETDFYHMILMRRCCRVYYFKLAIQR